MAFQKGSVLKRFRRESCRLHLKAAVKLLYHPKGNALNHSIMNRAKNQPCGNHSRQDKDTLQNPPVSKRKPSPARRRLCRMPRRRQYLQVSGRNPFKKYLHTDRLQYQKHTVKDSRQQNNRHSHRRSTKCQRKDSSKHKLFMTLLHTSFSAPHTFP